MITKNKKIKRKLVLFVEFVISGIIIFSVFGLRNLYGKYFIKKDTETVQVENQSANKVVDNKKEINKDENKKKEQEKIKLTSEQKNEKIDNIINKYITANNKISVVYNDIKGKYRYSYNDSEYFPAASTTKVVYALFVYDKVAMGKIPADLMINYNPKFLSEGGGEITNQKKKSSYPLDDVIMNMLTYSDNTATNMLLENNANAEHVLSYYLKKLNVDYDDKMIAQNKLTTGILEKVWQYLYDNQEKYEKMISYLKNSENNEWIKKGVPNKTIASKYGAINNDAHDTAIVYDKNGDYLLLIYTEGVANSGDVIAEISNKIDVIHNESR